MKFASLRAVAHNIADSLADGNSFLFGFYDLDLFGEADRAACGYIEIDLLRGTCSETEISVQLATVVRTSSKVLQSLCAKHDTSLSAFRELRVRFLAGASARRFIVTVQSEGGRQSIDEYINGERLRILDHIGRLRKRRSGALDLPSVSKYY